MVAEASRITTACLICEQIHVSLFQSAPQWIQSSVCLVAHKMWTRRKNTSSSIIVLYIKQLSVAVTDEQLTIGSEG